MKNLMFWLVLILPSLSSGSGMQASFGGSRFPEPRESTVFWYNGDLTGAGDLLDHTENLTTYSDQLDQWLPTQLSVIADQYENPLDGLKTADMLHENSQNSARYINNSNDPIISGRRYTVSVYALPINRQQLCISLEGGTKNATIDIVTGAVISTSGNDTTAGYQRINGSWARVWMTSTATNNGKSYVYPNICGVYQGLDQDALALFRVNILDVTDGLIESPGVPIRTESATKPRLDLAPAGNPPTIESSYQNFSGNRLLARSFDGATQYYSRAHHDCMSINDSDHTYTFVFLRDEDATLGNWVFTHGNSNAGIFCGYYAADTYFDCYYGNGGGYVYARSNGSPPEGVYHVMQVVRRNDRAQMIVDGVPGNSISVSGYGIDSSTSLFIGSYNAGASSLKGKLLFASLDNRALSPPELTEDREKLQGIIARRTPGAGASWKFSRESQKWESYSTGGIRKVDRNVPSMGPYGGVRIDPPRTNLRTYSETITQNPPWIPVRASVTNTSTTIAPDGTTTVNKVLHEDNTAAASHAITLSAYASNNGFYYTSSVYLKPINRGWAVLWNQADPNGGVYFDINNCTVGNVSAGFTGRAVSVGNGWCRVQETHRALNTTQTFTLYIASANGVTSFNGLDQDSMFVLGLQNEENKFATTYCGPTGSSTGFCYGDGLVFNPRILEGAFLVVGDSISRDIAPYLANATGINNLVGIGIGGNTLEDVRNRWPSDVTPWGPSTVLLHCGVNDILNFGRTLGQMQTDIEWIATRAESENIRLIVDNTGTANTYTDPMVAQVNAWNTWLATTFAAAHPTAVVLDFMGWAQNGSGNPKVCEAGWFDAVCVHPNNTGYPLWSAIVAASTVGTPLKQSIVLPKYFGPTSPYNKLTVELEARCSFTNSTNITISRQLLSVGGLQGTAHATRNHLDIQVSSAGRIYAYLYDDTGSAHYGYTASDPLLFDRWFKVRAFFDLSDGTRNYLKWGYADDEPTTTGVSYVGNTGTYSWDTTNNLIRVGQEYNGTISGACEFRNILVDPVER